MDDLINRQTLLEKAWDCLYDGKYIQVVDVGDILELPSALSETELRKTGEWDMFELITSAWYGKQCYFKQENGMAYSRVSGKMMTEYDAVKEFLREIADE